MSIKSYSWIKEPQLRWFESLTLKFLKCGPIPAHMAFIMDGNRRFASRTGVVRIAGHSKGFDRLTDTIEWFLSLGVREVTVYAFSIENLKRSRDEIDSLMGLARDKFADLLAEKERLAARGVRIRVIGNLSLLPLDVQKLMIRAMEITRFNDKFTLNMAISYTSREEMSNAVAQVFISK